MSQMKHLLGMLGLNSNEKNEDAKHSYTERSEPTLASWIHQFSFKQLNKTALGGVDPVNGPSSSRENTGQVDQMIEICFKFNDNMVLFGSSSRKALVLASQGAWLDKKVFND